MTRRAFPVSYLLPKSMKPLSCPSSMEEHLVKQARVYLAGPDVFERDPFRVASELKQICGQHGLEGVFPLDAGIKADPDLSEFAYRISQANEELIRSCDGVLANLSPFRGPSADPGTLFEVGFARALGKPIIGYTDSPLLYAARSLEWAKRTGGGVVQRASGGFEDANGFEIEDFGCIDNLMIDCGIAASSGMVVRPKDAAERGAEPAAVAIEAMATLLADR